MSTHRLLPRFCPVCKTVLKWTRNNKNIRVDLFCPNDKCTGGNARQLVHFFKVLFADGILEPTVLSMMAAGLKDIPSILSATSKQLAKVEGFADKKIQNMLLSMKKLASEVPLAKLAHASGIFTTQSTGIGETLLEPIIKKLTYKGVLEKPINEKKMLATLVALPNIGEERARIFIKHLPAFREFVKSVPTIKLAPENKKGKLTGKVFAFSEFRDAGMHMKIEANGGKVSNSLSKNVNVLFTAGPSLKTTKALDYNKTKQANIKIITKDKASDYLRGLLNESK